MDRRDLDDERADALSRLFALLTARLEDVSTLAAEGQGRRSGAELRDIARRIHDFANDCATITAAVTALLDTRSSA